MYYITAVTVLLEHVAHIIDQHQPVVEKHYGSGKMKFVALKILEECDRIIQRLLDGWEEERATKRKVNQIPFITRPFKYLLSSCKKSLAGHLSQ
jgi:hypothetical protein